MLRFFGIAAAALLATSALAQEKIPALSTDRPVTIVTSGSPGSSNDRAARVYSEVAQKHTDQRFIIENQTGAAGANAMNAVTSRPADGLTLLAWTKSYAIIHYTQPGAANLADKMHFIGITMYAPFVVFTYADGSPYKDAKSVFDDCKAHPGTQQWAGSPPGFVDWLMMMVIWKTTGCQGQYIPYDDGASQTTAVMGKQVPLSAGDMGDIVGRTDILKPLVIASPERDPRLPDVPTLKELGYDIVQQQHRGLAAMKDIPDAAKEFHRKLYEAVIADPDWKKYIEDQRAVIGGGGTEEQEKVVRQTQVEAEAMLKEAGIIK